MFRVCLRAETGYELASLLKGLIPGSGKDSFLCRGRCQQRWDCLNAHTSLVHLNRGRSWRCVPSSIKEQQSAIQGIISAVNDLRYAWRMLVRSPGFTLAAVALLSAGIGTSVVIFSALEAVWLRTLPVKHPAELVRTVQKSSPIGTTSYFVSDFYAGLRDHAATLSAVLGEEEEPFIQMSAPAPADLIWVNLVTPEYFDALGVSALYGRTFRMGDPVERPF